MKKEEELEILNKVYNETNGYVITSSEKPDFILEKDGEKFGVEITKLYYNTSSARLKEIPDYTYKLLRNGIPRNDQGILNPHMIFVSVDGAWKYLGDTIGEKFKTYDDYISALVRLIKNKTEKAKDYQKLDYLELFVDDRERYLFFKDISELKYLEQSPELLEVLKDSPFKRIYIFTIIDKKSFLLIKGDLTSGPFQVSEETMVAHQKYMADIYKGHID